MILQEVKSVGRGDVSPTGMKPARTQVALGGHSGRSRLECMKGAFGAKR
jgi:hypothetical protein